MRLINLITTLVNTALVVGLFALLMTLSLKSLDGYNSNKVKKGIIETININ